MSPSSRAFLHMRPSSLFVSLLILSFLLHRTEGIRLDGSFKQATHQKFHVENSSPMGRSTNKNGGAREVIFCKEGHCTGITRKLATVTTSTATTTSTKSEENEDSPNSKGDEKLSTISSSPSSNEDHQEATHDRYVELLDIAEMDYSPARRKPPVHN